jgi:hypothetical protein
VVAELAPIKQIRDYKFVGQAEGDFEQVAALEVDQNRSIRDKDAHQRGAGAGFSALGVEKDPVNWAKKLWGLPMTSSFPFDAGPRQASFRPRPLLSEEFLTNCTREMPLTAVLQYATRGMMRPGAERLGISFRGHLSSARGAVLPCAH